MIFCVGRKYLLNYLALWMICLNFALTIDMSVKVKDVIRALELFAPLPLQESYDNAEDGVNYRIAEKLGLQDVELMMPRRVMVSIEDHEQPIKAGSGVIGYLPESDDSLQFLQRVKEAFGVECLMHNELLQRPIQSVAICGGAGDFMLDEAIRLQADAFLTGEMHYHQFFGHDQQIQIAVLGHYQSERYTPDLLFSVLGRSFPSLPLFRSTVNTNPIKYL